MPVVLLDGLSFCGLAQTFQFLPRKHTETGTWHTRPFVSTFLETSIWSHRMIEVNYITPCKNNDYCMAYKPG
jgi:hypothetical protein